MKDCAEMRAFGCCERACVCVGNRSPAKKILSPGSQVQQDSFVRYGWQEGRHGYTIKVEVRFALECGLFRKRRQDVRRIWKIQGWVAVPRLHAIC